MPALTASSTFMVAASAVLEASAEVEIIAPLGATEGRGRIIHPTLGTYDYESMPDRWVGFGAALDVVPITQSQLTLGGAAHTVWHGTPQDADRQETWESVPGLSMSREQMETLLAFYSNSPATGQYIEWYPNYVSPQGFRVLMTGLTVAGEAIGRDFWSLFAASDGHEWMTGEVTVTWRVISIIG